MLWRGCLVLPFVYIGLALIVESIWFEPQRPRGFLALSRDSLEVLISVFGGLAVGAEVGVLLVRRHFVRAIEIGRSMPGVVAALYWRRTVWMCTIADTVCMLGFLIFLSNREWTPMVLFCGLSYFMYAQSYPRFSKITGRRA